jgi:hypothetical protein
MDVCVAPFLILAFWAFQSRRDMLGAALFLIASLIKWQPLILIPFIGVYLFEISDLRSCLNVMRRRLFWQLVILVAVTITLFSWLFGLAPARALRYAMSEGFLSGNALNVPWIAGYFYKLLFSSAFLVRTALGPLHPSTFIYLLPFRIIFWIIFVVVVIRATRVDNRFEYLLQFSIVGFLTYVIWNSSVHENHLFVPVILAYMLMLHKYTLESRAITAIITAMFNVNLFVFYGVTGTPPQYPVLGIDLSVILAMLYVIAWLLLAAYAWRAAEPRKEAELSK